MSVPRIAIFYHVRLDGGNPPCSMDWASGIMAEQMSLIQKTGLADAAQEIHIGVNGGLVSAIIAESLAPKKSTIWVNGDNAESELPSMSRMQEWLPEHEDWSVLSFHCKGATHPGDKLVTVWRRCMERAVIHNWRRCVADLDAGMDTVGAHWLTCDQYPTLVKTWFWGGNFWWAKASFLKELPPLPKQPKCREDFFIAENWIGFGRRPVVKDYAPHWPGLVPCAKL